MFENIIAAPADPILGLADLFRADPRPTKINLGIGVYKDEHGQTPILNSVKKAEQQLLACENSKNYLSIEGMAAFNTSTLALLFGKNSPILSAQRALAAQTPGGTGALRVAADFLANKTQAKRVWVSQPSWPNHRGVFTAAGLEVVEYTYYDSHRHQLDFSALLESLNAVAPGEVVLFHGCCHNPTGIDPTPQQWETLATLSTQKGWLPLFDFAYQGFANGLEEDAQGLRIFAGHHPELLIASSYSKNFGLYNERVGACTLVASDSTTVNNAFSQLKSIIRANYSNPPTHGAAIVATILADPTLRTMWEQELTAMRQRIQKMRQQLVNTLKAKGAKQDFSFIAQQNGMFSFSGLTQQQVLTLRQEFGIYAVDSGRINVAGLTLDNMDPLCEAIVAVLKPGK